MVIGLKTATLSITLLRNALVTSLEEIYFTRKPHGNSWIDFDNVTGRQDYSVPPIGLLLNLYLDDPIRTCKMGADYGFKLNVFKLSILLYADDQIVSGLCS